MTSDTVRPVAIAATSRLGVEVPLGLLEATDAGLFSCIDCVEFCLAREVAGLPFAGGDTLVIFVSGKVLRIGEDAMDGDIADVTVLFL